MTRRTKTVRTPWGCRIPEGMMLVPIPKLRHQGMNIELPIGQIYKSTWLDLWAHFKAILAKKPDRRVVYSLSIYTDATLQGCALTEEPAKRKGAA